jgi:hypothetical protein
MKAINKDKALAALRIKLREAQAQKNGKMAAITNACITIISGMPEIDVTDGIECGNCWYYDAAHKHCTHANGLLGRIRPKMYCSFGCARPDRDQIEENIEEDWSEFDDENIDDQGNAAGAE